MTEQERAAKATAELHAARADFDTAMDAVPSDPAMKAAACMRMADAYSHLIPHVEGEVAALAVKDASVAFAILAGRVGP